MTGNLFSMKRSHRRWSVRNYYALRRFGVSLFGLRGCPYFPLMLARLAAKFRFHRLFLAGLRRDLPAASEKILVAAARRTGPGGLTLLHVLLLARGIVEIGVGVEAVSVPGS